VDAFFPYLDDHNRCDFHSMTPPALAALSTPHALQSRLN
jgi:hypothetical protein